MSLVHPDFRGKKFFKNWRYAVAYNHTKQLTNTCKKVIVHSHTNILVLETEDGEEIEDLISERIISQCQCQQTIDEYKVKPSTIMQFLTESTTAAKSNSTKVSIPRLPLDTVP